MDSILENKLYAYKGLDKCVFKSCNKEWIVVLKPTLNTKTNERRLGVLDKNYAKFRGDEFMVIDIIHKFDITKKIESIQNSVYRSKRIIYKIGNVARSDDYDCDINKVCSYGIHYFKDPEIAFYYGLELTDLKTFGVKIYKKWYDFGPIKEEYRYKGNIQSGTRQQWYKNGQIMTKFCIKYGKKDGEYQEWFENGHKCIECIYRDGKKDGEYREWFVNGHNSIECTYKDGKLDGHYQTWNVDNGYKHDDCYYKSGNLNGPRIVWYGNRKLCDEYYVNGKKMAQLGHGI